MVGKRVLQGSRDLDFPRAFHVTSRPVREIINSAVLGSLGESSSNRLWTLNVLVSWELLWSANAFEETLWSFVCSASWKAGELSAIESAVAVIISKLLSVCVARSVSAVIACDLRLFVFLTCISEIVPVTCVSCFPNICE
ncbi:hypothetical protein AVEN_9111-1 [Araneus ventricosus]|uniref:Uncharacterized protein n=1 Tax=Araneus ventricosus TaxID=182803 RepID=A0A4Y2PDK0_ARAVE|nr:hypothetical protein AVEN_9111-1 [Araneus ventricosus]